MSQFEARNISMMMDLYEMTMANGYFDDSSADDWGTFEVFYRKIRTVADLPFLPGWNRWLNTLRGCILKRMI